MLYGTRDVRLASGEPMSTQQSGLEFTMKFASIIAALTLAAGLVAPASPANAAGCVTKSEYRQLRSGMSQTQVKNIFGTTGSVLSQSSGYGITIVMRTYKTCAPYKYGSISIMFQNNRLDTKSAIWI